LDGYVCTVSRHREEDIEIYFPQSECVQYDVLLRILAISTSDT
jgi:hypothetical protein